MQNKSMLDKVVFITGASSGLGAHFARVLSAAGAKVIVGARRVEKLAQLVTDISQTGGSALAVNLDVTDASIVDAAIATGYAEFGPIDTLINNAGVASPNRFVNVNESDWQFIMDTNLTGAWRMAQALTKHMMEHQITGSIVNIASILGLRVGFGESSYAVSKAGIVQLTKSMALELANKNIRVNALCPGYFETEMNQDYFSSEQGQAYIKTTPAKRVGQLDELNGPLLLLAGKEGSFINGVALAVDGGHMVSSL
jgi:NAD(P)-dependent dehydrogenase (short-subunit alcohol dehydrogenase family)